MTILAKVSPATGFLSLRSAAGLCLLTALALTTRAETRPEKAVPGREPVLRIRAEASFDIAGDRRVRVGDTLAYRLRVFWNEIPAAVMLNPREALDAPGFTVAGSSVAHARITVDGEVVNRTDYIYDLVPREAGTARVPAFTVRYHNGLTGREEELGVPAAHVAVSPAPVPLTERTGVPALLALAATILIGLSLLGGLVLTRRRRARKHPKDGLAPRNETPETAALTALRSRCHAAESRVWIADAERLCISWLCRRIGVTSPDRVRFEAALDQYLERHRGLSLAVRESWTTLRDLFHETRYGGTRREPHELHEICGLLKTCLLIDHRDADLKPIQTVKSTRE